MTTPFSNRLRRLRQERNLTMEQLAEKVGVSKSYIWALENNPEKRSQRTSANVVNALAKALGVTLQDLMGEAPPEALGEEAKPEDVVFFRNYMGMSPDDRENVRKMVEIFKTQMAEKKKRDMTGAKAAIEISRWIEPWGEARFPVDVEFLARGAHTMYGWDDAITLVHAGTWKDFDGFLLRNPENPKQWAISYSENMTPGRQRFTKAHELGHYVLHSRRYGEFRCGPDAIVEKDTGEENLEAQANQFASYLLMPANHVRPRIEKTQITLDLISELAQFYGVSFEAMCIRVVEITGERAVLVYWDNGMMRRWSRSEPAREQRLWIEEPKDEPLTPIPGTVAADTSIRQCPEGKHVPANLWFRNAPEGEMLREMKHTSDTYERVLSLLIVPKFMPRWEPRWSDDSYDTFDRFIERGQYPAR